MTPLPRATIWTVILAVGVATYALRALFLLGIDYFGSFPPTVERLLEFFPVAILSALVVPGLLVTDGTLAVTASNPRLVAGLVAVGVAWYTDSLLATVGVGMAVFWGLLAVA
ncbi:MAG: AzlD domain-containing protein [Haloferacaceae archaeon]